MQAGIREDNAGHFRETLACPGSKFVTPAAEQNIRHIGHETAGGIARGENRVELLQQTFAELLLFAFRLFAEALRLFSIGAGLCRIGSQCLLLGDRFGLRLLGFFFLASSLLRGGQRLLFHTLGFGFGLFCLYAGLVGRLAGGFRFRTASRFGFRIGAGFSFPSRSRRLRILFGLLLHRHNACFFGGLCGFLGGGFDNFPLLLLPIETLGIQELLAGLGKNRRR